MTIGKKVKKKLEGTFVPTKTRIALSPGDAVRVAREILGLSQNDLSRLTGISQATISGIEKNRIKLGVERAKVLALALEVHPAVLLFPNWEAEKKKMQAA